MLFTCLHGQTICLRNARLLHAFKWQIADCGVHKSDSLIGEILTELDELGLANNTIVTFMGDHGYHLGEHGIFGKNTNFEVANNAPMIIRVPGITDGGQVTDKLVEFVDMFPTLVELTGHPSLPHCPQRTSSSSVSLCTEGSSLVPLFHDQNTDKWKDRVFYQYPRFVSATKDCMGYSMRTRRYRYTEWVRYDYSTGGIPNWEDKCSVELYDHSVDPHETNNIAIDAGLQEVTKGLSSQLRQGWRAAVVS